MTTFHPAISLLLAAPAIALALSGCDAGPRPIAYGQDECAECRMTLADRHYGAELITSKGKVFTFDDVNCLLDFRRRPEAGHEPRIFVIDFNHPNTFLPVAQALLIKHDRLRSPMGSGLAAFSTEAEREAAHRELGGGGRLLRWPEIPHPP